jgi:voltage-gated potassium channel
MKIKLISSIPLFKSCSLNCLREISLTLEQTHFSPGEIIINKGDDGNEMFIIGHGIVEVIIKDGQVSNTFQTGQYFGEIGLLKNAPRGAVVRAQSYCDVYKLTRESFLPIINKNPKVLNEIRGMILKRSTDRK